MTKSPDAFRTISEVAEWLGVQTHVLRFWESKFTQVKPVKRAGGRRYYRPADMELLGGIKKLLHDDGMTIKGVQKLLREEGIGHVAAQSQSLEVGAADEEPIAENVLRFMARPEDKDSAEEIKASPIDAEDAASLPPETDTDAPAEPEPVAEDVVDAEVAEEDASPSPLPAFLTQPMDGPADPPAPKPTIVDAPDPPAEELIPATASALTFAAHLHTIDAETMRELSPLIGRLAALRDRLSSTG